MKVLVLNGPNLNLLGRREVDIYGDYTLAGVEKKINDLADELGLQTEFLQSNHEGVLIDWLHQAATDGVSVVILNPGALTHYSIALRDAIASIDVPVIEVHISNIYSREEFRRESVIAPVAAGQIAGFGVESYLLAVHAAARMAKRREITESC